MLVYREREEQLKAKVDTCVADHKKYYKEVGATLTQQKEEYDQINSEIFKLHQMSTVLKYVWILYFGPDFGLLRHNLENVKDANKIGAGTSKIHPKTLLSSRNSTSSPKKLFNGNELDKVPYNLPT